MLALQAFKTDRSNCVGNSLHITHNCKVHQELVNAQTLNQSSLTPAAWARQEVFRAFPPVMPYFQLIIGAFQNSSVSEDIIFRIMLCNTSSSSTRLW